MVWTSEEILQATIDVFQASTGLGCDALAVPMIRDALAVIAYEVGANSRVVADTLGMCVETVRPLVTQARNLDPRSRTAFFKIANDVLDRLENTSKVGPK